MPSHRWPLLTPLLPPSSSRRGRDQPRPENCQASSPTFILHNSYFIILSLLLLFLPACKDRSLQQRTEQIRQYSDQENRRNIAQAVHQIQRQFWTLRDHTWIGKLPDGTLIRLDTPHLTAAPLPSRAFYVGWHLQLTLSSDDWRTYPPSDNSTPFQAIYAITRHGPTNWQIDVTSGPETTPVHREDVLRLEAE